MKYRVLLADIDSAKDVLCGLWGRNLDLSGDLSGKYSWYYQKNPAGKGIAFFLEAVSDGDKSEIVGSAGIGNRFISIHGNNEKIALLCDFVVNKEHRTIFPAFQLQRSVRKYCTENYRLTYLFPNELAKGIFIKSGYEVIGDIRRYVHVLNYTPYVQKAGIQKRLSSVLGEIIYFLSKIRYPKLLIKFLDPRHFLRLDGFDKRFNSLWAQTSKKYPIIGERTAEFLKWRFSKGETDNIHIYGLTSENENILHAYAIVEIDGDVARVRDVFGESYKDMEVVIRRLTSVLKSLNCNSISLRFLGSSVFVKSLIANGYIARKDKKQVLLGFGKEFDLDKKYFLEADYWHLLDVDEDQ